jgi:hypothetical protein
VISEPLPKTHADSQNDENVARKKNDDRSLISDSYQENQNISQNETIIENTTPNSKSNDNDTIPPPPMVNANAASLHGNATAQARNQLGGSATANAQVEQGGMAQAFAKSEGGSKRNGKSSDVLNKIAVATAMAGKGGLTRAEVGRDNIEAMERKGYLVVSSEESK